MIPDVFVDQLWRGSAKVSILVGCALIVTNRRIGLISAFIHAIFLCFFFVARVPLGGAQALSKQDSARKATATSFLNAMLLLLSQCLLNTRLVRQESFAHRCACWIGSEVLYTVNYSRMVGPIYLDHLCLGLPENPARV